MLEYAVDRIRSLWEQAEWKLLCWAATRHRKKMEEWEDLMRQESRRMAMENEKLRRFRGHLIRVVHEDN